MKDGPLGNCSLGFGYSSNAATKFRVARAVDEVIVDHSSGLHVGIHDGGADELEAALAEVFAEGVGDVGAGGDIF